MSNPLLRQVAIFALYLCGFGLAMIAGVGARRLRSALVGIILGLGMMLAALWLGGGLNEWCRAPC